MTSATGSSLSCSLFRFRSLCRMLLLCPCLWHRTHEMNGWWGTLAYWGKFHWQQVRLHCSICALKANQHPWSLWCLAQMVLNHMTSSVVVATSLCFNTWSSERLVSRLIWRQIHKSRIRILASDRFRRHAASSFCRPQTLRRKRDKLLTAAFIAFVLRGDYVGDWQAVLGWRKFIDTYHSSLSGPLMSDAHGLKRARSNCSYRNRTCIV